MPTAERQTSIDSFHRGKFWVAQPVGGGHRAGLDAMVLAATVPADFAGTVADLGAGAGAAGLAVLARCPAANAVLVERSTEMAGYARETLVLPQNAAIVTRASVLEANVELTGLARAKAGLADNSFDFVIMNPPFNAGHDRASPDALRKDAHVMDDGLWENWLRTAAAIVRSRGGLALIARPESLPEILTALQGRFGRAELLPILAREHQSAIRIVVRAICGARKGLSIVPPLVLHGTTGNRFADRADDICNGVQSLFGD